MNQTIYSKTFLETSALLTSRERKQIDSAVMDFARGSTSKGLRLHKLNCRETRFHSISASKELRIIVLIDGNRRVVMHAGHHDDAYRWAERHQVKMHDVTGSPQIIEFIESVEKRIAFGGKDRKPSTLFRSVDDQLLLTLGIPTDYLSLVNKVRDENDLEKLLGILPEEAWEALVEISAGALPEQLVAERLAKDAVLDQELPKSEVVFDDPYLTPSAQRRFWIAENEEALNKALTLPWALWRVFLHPSQQRWVESDFSGPARITGGAGTGKSVVVVHRAVRLAGESPSSTVLVSTFSKPLAVHLAKSLDDLVSNDDDLCNRIDTIHLYEHAMSTLVKVGHPVSLATVAEVRRRISLSTIHLGYLAHPISFLIEEWDRVVDFWGVESKASYENVSRIGRNQALSKSQRSLIWPVFQRVLDSLTRDGLRTRASICQLATEYIREESQRYDHVLLDEAQDFGPRELRYAQALCCRQKNGLFLASDDGQRIYQNPYPLKSIGINIRGRSRRLRVNYRTSRAIHNFSVGVLPEEYVDESNSHPRGITSLFSGAEPQIIGFDSLLNEAAGITHWVEECVRSGIRLSDIAILGRNRKRLSRVGILIGEECDWSCVGVVERSDGNVCLDTLHAAKGLEFRAVAVVGADESTIPLSSALEGEPGDHSHALSLARERHLLFVGCTRARERLLVTYQGEPSLFIPQSIPNVT